MPVLPKITVLGLGAMGAGMAANLQQQGLLHSVWNRGELRAQQFAEANGIEPVKTVRRAVRGADIVLSCVSADDDLLELVADVAPVLPTGTLWIDCSTVAVATARQAHQYLATHDVGFIDAPVSGGQEGAKNGSLAIMAGGDALLFDVALPVFQAIGSRWLLMGPVGSGQATKAVNQIMAAGINQAVTEAMAFAESQGLPIAEVVDVVGSGAAGNWFVNHRGLSMTESNFQPGFKLALHHKDLKICQEMAIESGAPTAVIEQVLNDYERLLAEGYGEEDISALYRLKQAR